MARATIWSTPSLACTGSSTAASIPKASASHWPSRFAVGSEVIVNKGAFLRSSKLWSALSSCVYPVPAPVVLCVGVPCGIKVRPLRPQR